jgi:hypothetical protein
MMEPLSVPWAVPTTFRLPAQVALKEPLADVAVCSVGFHLKSEQVDGDGIALDDVDAQVPINALTLGALGLGLVVVLVCSKLVQPAAAAARASTDAKM